jgi:hypothetical protein
MLPALNLPSFEARIRLNRNGKQEILDPFRRKYVRLTPEEWVRQHFLHFMVTEHAYPPSLIRVEASIAYNGLSKRSDIVVYSKSGKPQMAVECKAPGIEISQEVFYQLAMYNYSLGVSYLVMTNGMDHYIGFMDPGKNSFAFLNEFPSYGDLIDRFRDI